MLQAGFSGPLDTYLNPGTGVFSSTPSATRSNANSVNFHLADITGDGYKDIVVARGSAAGYYAQDATPPTVLSISSDKVAGSYKAGETIDIDVTFSENVTSTGSVTVTLETGAIDRTCTFIVTNASTGTCNYVVQANDTSLDLDATISGTIADQVGNSLSSFTPTTSLATNEALVIDTAVPTLSGFSPIDGTTSAGASNNLVLIFAENAFAGSGTIRLYRSDDTLIQSFDVASGISGSGTINIAVNPTYPLLNAVQYYVQVDAGALVDAAGNAFAGIADETTWNFITTADHASSSKTQVTVDTDTNDQDSTTDNGNEATISDSDHTADKGSDESEDVNASAELTAPSPYDHSIEVVNTTLKPGDVIRGEHFSTIYLVTENMERRPFWNEQIFFTWGYTWSEVLWVTDATLPMMALGEPIMPKHGTVLVKIQSNPKVYAIEEGNVLRWLSDEETATVLYGDSWNQYIIDVEPTIFARFTFGDDMRANENVDRGEMMTREELFSLLM